MKQFNMKYLLCKIHQIAPLNQMPFPQQLKSMQHQFQQRIVRVSKHC